MPENLPAPLYARKVQRRAASTGFDFPGIEGPLQAVRDELDELEQAQTPESASTSSATCCSRRSTSPASCTSTPSSRCAPRRTASAARLTAASELAAAEGRNWNDLRPDEQLAYYARARLNEGDSDQQMSQIEHVHARQILDSRGATRRSRSSSACARAPGAGGRAVGRLDRRYSRPPSSATAAPTGSARA